MTILKFFQELADGRDAGAAWEEARAQSPLFPSGETRAEKANVREQQVWGDVFGQERDKVGVDTSRMLQNLGSMVNPYASAMENIYGDQAPGMDFSQAFSNPIGPAVHREDSAPYKADQAAARAEAARKAERERLASEYKEKHGDPFSSTEADRWMAEKDQEYEDKVVGSQRR